MKALLAAVGACVALGVAVFAQSGTVKVVGSVPRPLTLNASDIAALPHQMVTTEGRGGIVRYEGVPLIEILKRAGAATGEALRGPELAKYVLVSGADGYRTVFALAELDAAFTDRVVILADKRDGAPLPDTAAPYQIIVPGEKRPARWVRQVVAIDVMEAPSGR
jgi:DMSO/TMAO reductase YedYZ molybdopterin-dependent catalytic subunit